MSAVPDRPETSLRPTAISRFTRLAPVFFLLLLCVGCDQAVKSAARRTLAGSDPVSLMAGIVRLEYAENPGAFLSLGASLPPGARFAGFAVLAAIVAGAVLVLVLRGREWHASRVLAFSLILGGGIGNLLDRFFNGGAVVDFVSIGFGGLRTGIFNVADLAITCGALWLILHTAPWRTPAAPEA
ncbi:MAG TPA: signal peptidase II [Thermoanaerobaculia bacterium]|nr:signal peptidase II [Thermoanaerobaculia bacterium]